MGSAGQRERYAIFRNDGMAPMWVCPASNMAEAMEKMRQLTIDKGAEHFIWDFEQGTTVASEKP